MTQNSNQTAPKKYKGIVLSGGRGARLYPNTLVTTKQLLPIYSKPLVYYPITTLMLAGIRDIVIVLTPTDLSRFQELLGTGEDWGVRFEYVVQNEPNGIAECFILAEKNLAGCRTALILGDNLFYGHDFTKILQEAANLNQTGATIFATPVADPERFGVVELDSQHRALSLEEKPQHPKSPYAVTGLYFYDDQVVEIAKKLKPSARGELEITDLNRVYLDQKKLSVKLLGRGFSWFDTGTFDTLLEASNLIAGIEKRNGILVGCPEEIAYRNGWITIDQLKARAQKLNKSDYGKYLEKLSKGLTL